MFSPVKIWRNQKHIVQRMGKTGKVVSWTMIHVPQESFKNQAPYPVVLIDLDSGGRITAQMVDWDGSHVKIGQKVTTAIRRITQPTDDSIISYGIKVKPIEK